MGDCAPTLRLGIYAVRPTRRICGFEGWLSIYGTGPFSPHGPIFGTLPLLDNLSTTPLQNGYPLSVVIEITTPIRLWVARLLSTNGKASAAKRPAGRAWDGWPPQRHVGTLCQKCPKPPARAPPAARPARGALRTRACLLDVPDAAGDVDVVCDWALARPQAPQRRRRRHASLGSMTSSPHRVGEFARTPNGKMPVLGCPVAPWLLARWPSASGRTGRCFIRGLGQRPAQSHVRRGIS